MDADGDGVCDNFVDNDGDGINDNCPGYGNGQCGQNYVDADGDGVCDNFVDNDGDGINDNCPGYGNGQGQGNGWRQGNGQGQAQGNRQQQTQDNGQSQAQDNNQQIQIQDEVSTVSSPNKNVANATKKANAKKLTIKKIQRKLNKMGFKCGKANGVMNTKTKNALKKFKKTKGLRANSIIDKSTLKALRISK